MSRKRQVGRLALRQEGDNWNAYFALEHTMAGALLLGSIKLGIVQRNPRIKQQFMDLMRAVVAESFNIALGQRPLWDEPQSAPEAEKAGNA